MSAAYWAGLCAIVIGRDLQCHFNCCICLIGGLHAALRCARGGLIWVGLADLPITGRPSCCAC